MSRRRGLARINANKTRCKRGHPFDRVNTYHYFSADGEPRRRCKTCASAADRDWRQQRKGNR